jgi:glutamate 5-kinase
MASGAISNVGTGGMSTKISAAKMAFNSNCDTIIASGLVDNPIKSAKKFTIFKSGNNKISSKKKWIIDSLNTKGEIFINKCAVDALYKGSSLLPIGVEKVSGNFMVGDVVSIKDEAGKHIASGVPSYSAIEAKLVIGKKTPEVKKILGKKFKDELVNRDNLAVIK